jgi:hypothetical protein
MMEKRQRLQKMLLGKLDICLQKTENRSNSILLKDLNVRLEAMKLAQQRAGNTLEAIGLGNDFSVELKRLSN